MWKKSPNYWLIAKKKTKQNKTLQVEMLFMYPENVEFLQNS